MLFTTPLLTHQIGAVLSGVKGRCQPGPDFSHKQLHRCSAPWGAYSAGSSPLLHTPHVSCVQLSEGGENKQDEEVKGTMGKVWDQDWGKMVRCLSMPVHPSGNKTHQAEKKLLTDEDKFEISCWTYLVCIYNPHGGIW